MILPLKAHELTFTAGGRTLLAPLSLEIAAGPSTVIVGANGAGKSVLMRVCHGLLALFRTVVGAATTRGASKQWSSSGLCFSPQRSPM
jgi:ABC-type transport system involved in cytochrome c biogenesis ATPase subunit